MLATASRHSEILRLRCCAPQCRQPVSSASDVRPHALTASAGPAWTPDRWAPQNRLASNALQRSTANRAVGRAQDLLSSCPDLNPCKSGLPFENPRLLAAGQDRLPTASTAADSILTLLCTSLGMHGPLPDLRKSPTLADGPQRLTMPLALIGRADALSSSGS